MDRVTEDLLECIRWIRDKCLAAVAVCKLGDTMDQDSLEEAAWHLKAGFDHFINAVTNEASKREE